MSEIFEQNQPCPECGNISGWWSAIDDKKSMIFHEPSGNVREKRITEKKRKHCAECDSDITSLVVKRSR